MDSTAKWMTEMIIVNWNLGTTPPQKNKKNKLINEYKKKTTLFGKYFPVWKNCSLNLTATISVDCVSRKSENEYSVQSQVCLELKIQLHCNWKWLFGM